MYINMNLFLLQWNIWISLLVAHKRSVDELQAQTRIFMIQKLLSNLQCKTQYSSCRFEPLEGYNGEDLTAFVITPKEIVVVGTLRFLVCKLALVLAAFKPLKDGS